MQNLIQAQTARALFARVADESYLDAELQAVGLALVIEYAHLIQAAGSGGVIAVAALPPLFAHEKEDDALTIAALALVFLLQMFSKCPLTVRT